MKKFLKILAAILVILGISAAITLNLPTFGGSIEGDRLARVEASPHHTENGFRNPEPQAASEDGFAMLKEQFWGEQSRTPSIVIPVIELDGSKLDTPPAPGLRAFWLGHSSVLVEIDGHRILVDPVLSEYASPFQFAGPKRFHKSPISLTELRNIDAVLISHDHYDHLDMATVQHLAKDGTRFLVPLGIGAHLDHWGVPKQQITELDWWESSVLGTLNIHATPNRHYSGRGLTDYKATFWSSWSVIGPEHRIFYSGDTGYSKQFQKIGRKFGPFDLTIIKAGAYGPGQAWQDIHMEPENAVRVHIDVQGEQLLPVHWATFNMAFHDWDEPIERTITAAEAKSITLLTPKIGEMIDLSSDPVFEAWWRSNP